MIYIRNDIQTWPSYMKCTSFLKYKHMYIIYSRNWAALLSDESLGPIIWSARLTDTWKRRIKARSSRFLLHLCRIPTTELFTWGGFANSREGSKHSPLYVSRYKVDLVVPQTFIRYSISRGRVYVRVEVTSFSSLDQLSL